MSSICMDINILVSLLAVDKLPKFAILSLRGSS